MLPPPMHIPYPVPGTYVEVRWSTHCLYLSFSYALALVLMNLLSRSCSMITITGLQNKLKWMIRVSDLGVSRRCVCVLGRGGGGDKNCFLVNILGPLENLVENSSMLDLKNWLVRFPWQKNHSNNNISWSSFVWCFPYTPNPHSSSLLLNQTHISTQGPFKRSQHLHQQMLGRHVYAHVCQPTMVYLAFQNMHTL